MSSKIKLSAILIFLLTQMTNSFSQDMYSVVCTKTEGELLYGIILNDGTELIPVKYDFVCYNGLVFTYKFNGKYGFIDRSGKIVTDPIFEDFEFNSSEGLIRAKKNSKWGFVDQFGNTKIEFLYSEACNFKDGLAEVETENAVLTIDTTGKIVKENLDMDLEECMEDMPEIMSIDNLKYQQRFIVKTVDGKKGIVENIDGAEKVVIPFKYEYIFYYNKMFSAKINGLWCVYNEKGEMLFDAKFYRGTHFEPF
ncbi:MAG: WG repeat-containing protein [Crocinitomicaceae bacterium]